MGTTPRPRHGPPSACLPDLGLCTSSVYGSVCSTLRQEDQVWPVPPASRAPWAPRPDRRTTPRGGLVHARHHDHGGLGHRLTDVLRAGWATRHPARTPPTLGVVHAPAGVSHGKCRTRGRDDGPPAPGPRRRRRRLARCAIRCPAPVRGTRRSGHRPPPASHRTAHREVYRLTVPPADLRGFLPGRSP